MKLEMSEVKNGYYSNIWDEMDGEPDLENLEQVIEYLQRNRDEYHYSNFIYEIKDGYVFEKSTFFQESQEVEWAFRLV